MSINLVTMLERLGMTHKPRFTMDESAEILGVRRDQVIDLLKRGKLIGMKASPNRWSGVFAADLDDYIKKVNASGDDDTHANEQKGHSMGRSSVLLTPTSTGSVQTAPCLDQPVLSPVLPNPSARAQMVAQRPTDL